MGEACGVGHVVGCDGVTVAEDNRERGKGISACMCVREGEGGGEGVWWRSRSALQGEVGGGANNTHRSFFRSLTTARATDTRSLPGVVTHTWEATRSATASAAVTSALQSSGVRVASERAFRKATWALERPPGRGVSEALRVAPTKPNTNRKVVAGTRTISLSHTHKTKEVVGTMELQRSRTDEHVTRLRCVMGARVVGLAMGRSTQNPMAGGGHVWDTTKHPPAEVTQCYGCQSALKYVLAIDGVGNKG